MLHTMRVLLSRAVVLVSSAALLGATLISSSATANSSAASAAKAVPVPAHRVFTSAIEAYTDYNGQTLCNPVTKPGLAKLATLLRETYGSYSIGIVRDCASGGVSEHKEGRALDWMVSKRVPVQKAAAKSFLKWLRAPDEFGNPAAMARRLGVMYIGWNNKMWRAYDPGRGWDDLKGCSTTKSMKARGYDTYCHRNHIHLSFSWDGADGRTSFWTGRALTTEDCARQSSVVALAAAGGADDPKVLLDTATGAGTLARTTCRLTADRWSGDDRALKFSVPVPQDGAAYGLRVRVDRYDSNAPGSLRIAGSKAVAVKDGVTTPYETTLPIGAHGVVTVSTNAGQAYVRLVGLGVVPLTTSPTPPTPPGGGSAPAAVTLTAAPVVVTGRSFSLTGSVVGAPAGAKVVRYLKVAKGTWEKRGAAVRPQSGSWSMTTTAPSPQRLVYKAVLKAGGVEVARSAKRRILVTAGPPRSSLRTPSTAVRTGASFTLTGRVKDAPAGATVQRYLKVGTGYEARGTAATTATAKRRWQMTVEAPSSAGPLTYKIAVIVGGTVVGWSKVKTVPVS